MRNLISSFLLLSMFGLVTACSDSERIALPVPASESAVTRGQYLAEGFAACSFCHGSSPQPGSPLSGGRVMYDQYGQIEVPNISPHKSGVGKWKADELFGVMRSGKDPEGKTNYSDLHAGYQWLSDTDTLSLVAYVSRQQPVDNEVDRRSVSLVKRNTLGITKRGPKEVRGFVPEVEVSNELQHGKYIVQHVARCGVCHDGKPGFFGGRTPLEGGREVRLDIGAKVAPNIRGRDRRGLLRWSEDAVVTFLDSGKTASGKRVDSRFCPVEFYKNGSDSDKQAIAVYVKSLD
jgi:mono/diheme cytochrome c family protein